MIRALLAFALLLIAAPASAADRSYTVTSFDRIRVEGPFDVRLTVGNAGQSAKASGEADVLANLDISVQGTTLVIRKGTSGWGERGVPSGPAPVITLVTSTLRLVTVIGAGKMTASGAIRGQKLDVQITGAGSIDVKGIDSDELAVTVIGTGNVALAGTSNRARLVTNGAGTIMAIPLVVGDLLVRLDGPGETQVSARFTADLTSTGLGRIVVAGGAKCTIKAQAGGPILCGADATP